MNKHMTKNIKQLLCVVIILLLGLLYYLLVWVPTERIIEANDVLLLEDELILAQAKALKMVQMQRVIDDKGQYETGIIAGYNNLQNEIVELNHILQHATEYQLDFDDATVDGNMVRRNANIRFQTESYDLAKQVLQLTKDGKFKCLIRNVQITSDEGGLQQAQKVVVDVDLTFYEYVTNSEAAEGLQQYNGSK